ncbi:MAG: transcriptional repressor LexA [Planctomycetes bacterium]|nr:transcriptional repressor LexA [Planctomycetota bacterium]
MMNKKPDLTNRQSEIFNFIKRYAAIHGGPPKQVEIKEEFNLSSKATVHQFVKALEKKGYICRNQHGEISLMKRNLEKSEFTKTVRIPLYGMIPASPPTEVYADEDEMIDVPEPFIGQGEHFALLVQGESMKDADINDGDMVFIKRQSIASNGQIVAALLNHSEVTLKEFRRTEEYIVLHPHNREMNPIVIKDEPFEIQGIMVGLYRRY